jgi:nicotinate-nucleotide--dimethylbenzimidazole phosphoribosyltransferase
MTEILTESFCERCGTRYTFESARPRTRLKGVKVLSRGLKNFVLSDDTSIDEAMAAARSEAEREASSHQLDAFHKTFNFCMSCRQYTCPNCWNEAEARCLSCAPLALPDVAPDFRELRELPGAGLVGEGAPINGAPPIELAHAVWPAIDESDVPVADSLEASDEAIGEREQEPEELLAAADDLGAADEVAAPELGLVADAERTGEPGHPADKAASQTLGLLRRFRPGQSLDAELDAYERERGEAVSAEAEPSTEAALDDLGALQAERVAAAAERAETAPPDEVAALESAGTEPDVAVEPEAIGEAAEPVAGEELEPEPEAVAAVEPEPVVAEAPEPEPIPAAPEQPAAPPIAAAAASDVVEQPTWRITAPDPTPAAPAIPDQGGGPVPLQASGASVRPAAGEPQWPARPEWPAASASAVGLPFLGRPATPEGGIDALWAASNQELVTAAPAPGKVASGIQPCISCGLSLSATARFCRRCGTLQVR